MRMNGKKMMSATSLSGFPYENKSRRVLSMGGNSSASNALNNWMYPRMKG